MFGRTDLSDDFAARDLALKLQKLRAEKHATQRQIADLVGIDESTLRNYELARRTPKPEHLAALASALGVMTEALKTYDVRILPEETIHAFVQLGSAYGFEPGGDETYAYLKPTNRFTDTSIRRWAEQVDYLIEDGEDGRATYELWKDNFRESYTPSDFPAIYPAYDPADSTAGARRIADSLKLKLQSLRKQKGWSQNDLADATGLSKSTIRSYEQGTRLPRDDQRATLARAFEVNPVAFVFYDFGSPNQAIHALFQFAGAVHMHPVIDENLGPIVRTCHPIMHWWMLEWLDAFSALQVAEESESATESYVHTLDTFSSESEDARTKMPRWIDDHYKRVHIAGGKADDFYWTNEDNPAPLCNVKA